MIQSIIFSKNRPAQLELFLRSIKKYWINWNIEKFTILYKYDEEFKSGYDLVKILHPEFNYVLEDSEFKQLLHSLIDPYIQLLTFFTDDDCFIESFDIKCNEVSRFIKDINIICLSLRMSKYINYHYELGSQPVPELKDNVWEWRKCRIDWGYPFSVEGHIFRTQEIKAIMKRIGITHCCNIESNFDETMKYNPNYLENDFQCNRQFFKSKMMCFDRHKIFNNPVNMVQSIFNNKHEGISLSDINNNFINGKKIKIYDNVNNNSVHFAIPLEWI